MTCTLILMRHAKSSWTDADLIDHQRPLNKRGIRSAAALGVWLKEKDHVPDQILCSSAARAQETCAGLSLGLPAPAVTSLYHAEPEAMLHTLHMATGRSVLMIGHNPGISLFAESLVVRPPCHARFHDYPTGATLVAEFQSPTWNDVRWHSGTVRDFIVPRDLTDPA